MQADQAVRSADCRRIDIRPVEAVLYVYRPWHRFETAADLGQGIGRRARGVFPLAHGFSDRRARAGGPVIDNRA